MKQNKDFTPKQKLQIVQFLLVGSKNGRAGHGRRAAAVIKFKSTVRTVARIWAEAKEQQELEGHMTVPYGKLNSRAKRVEINLELIASLDMGQRSTQRRLADNVSCSQGTVRKWLSTGLIKPHTNSIKPDLTAPNKLLRLRFSLEAIEIDRILNILKFKSMKNIVHIDEKWFYMTKGVKRFYMVPGEMEPHRTCKSKKFITKVMFMCAVCRPMYDEDGSLVFDGKIGMWPFTEEVPAKRSSKNRVAGTLETKPIHSVTKSVIRDCIINQILPTIREKWPITANKHILIQQDNAKPHITNNDQLFREAANLDGFQFTLVQQPPNSPDTNVNDLGWFRSLEALQQKTSATTVDQLIGAVMSSFNALDHVTLNNVFLSLQGVMIEIMAVKGGNNYILPHQGKGALIRSGTLPINLEVSQDLVRNCITYLIEEGEVEGGEMIRDALGMQLLDATEEAY